MFKKLLKIVSFENESNPNNELSKNFDHFLNTDFHLAMDLIDNNYVPTKDQIKKLNQCLEKDALKNGDFLYKHQKYVKYITAQSIINFLSQFTLDAMCKNGKTKRENFYHILEYVCNDEKNAKLIFDYFLAKTFETREAVIITRNEMKYPKVLSEFLTIHYNSLCMFPIICKNINEFSSLKSNLVTGFQKVIKFSESANAYYILRNKSELIHKWKNFMNSDSINNVQKNLFDKELSKNQIEKSSSFIEKEKEEISQMEKKKLFEEINSLSCKLKSEHQETIKEIFSLYNEITKHSSNISIIEDSKNIMKNIPQIINKFLSIHEDYRETLRNVENKKPEDLMAESLFSVLNKFNEFLESLNQEKVTELSIEARKIRMKT